MSLTCDVFPEFYTHSEPVARKRHVCCECSAPIEKGERHFHYRGKWDGVMGGGRQHLLCMRACMFIRDNLNGYECIPFGALREWWSEFGRWNKPGERSPKILELRTMLAEIIKRERRSR